MTKLGRAPRPRIPPSAADPSALAGVPLATEDDVLHLRHLPEFGGALRPGDVEALLQMLLCPYLRAPLVLRFFAQPSRTAALSHPELQRTLDAALFEPGEWQPPDKPKAAPLVIPGPDRDHLATPAGCLLQELTHSPAAILTSVKALLENALELDPGRYLAGGAAEVLLYSARLAVRVESFACYLLSPESASVRGLRTPSLAAREGALRALTDELHNMLVEQVLPLIVSWYARCRRDGEMGAASALAAHIAFVTHAVLRKQRAAGAAVSDKEEQLQIFSILSSRVFINVHHDYGLEPRTTLDGAKAASKRSGTVDGDLTLGFEPLDVFDLWQRSLGDTMGWLHAKPDLANEIMENIVRLLSGDAGGGGGGGGGQQRAADAPSQQVRVWRELPAAGCDGRFVPGGGVDDAAGAGGGAAATAAGGAGAKTRGGAEVYEAWLRQHVSTVSETEVNVQLGELTLNQHQMQLLDPRVAETADFVAVFGEGAAGQRHQCGEVERTEHRHWLRLIAVEHDVRVWDADPRPPPGPMKIVGASDAAAAETAWVGEALKKAKLLLPVLASANVVKTVHSSDSHALLYIQANSGVPREAMLTREPVAVHVWRLESYGRRWLPVFEATTDTRSCMAESHASSVYLHATPAPHWASGDPCNAANDAAISSVVVTRPKSHGGSGEEVVALPDRYLRGLVPEALLGAYRFWQRKDGSLRGERRDASDGGGGAPADELAIEINDASEAIVQRVPLDAGGAMREGGGRLLLTHLRSHSASPIHQLVALLHRLDDASHVLMWSAPEGEWAAAAAAAAAARPTGAPSRSTSSSCRGSASPSACATARCRRARRARGSSRSSTRALRSRGSRASARAACCAACRTRSCSRPTRARRQSSSPRSRSRASSPRGPTR